MVAAPTPLHENIEGAEDFELFLEFVSNFSSSKVASSLLRLQNMGKLFGLMCCVFLFACHGFLDDLGRGWSVDGGWTEVDEELEPSGDGSPSNDGGSWDAHDGLESDTPATRPVSQGDSGTLPTDVGGVVAEELVPPGGACICDSDCENTGGYEPLCIHGICGVHGTDNGCLGGSTTGCPGAHRCWSGTGRGVCYPDYVSGSCDGAQDSDGSCVGSDGQDCYSVCGVLCDLSGEPPGTVEPDDGPLVDPSDCEYPEGPYRLGQGSVVAPMRWSSAIVGPGETGSADVADLFCDPDVSSIFIEVGATYCPSCGDRMREIAALREHWIATGVRWIFIVSDVESASSANDYVTRYGIDFGFRTNDADNSEGSGTIASSSLFYTIPWVGVIRADDMIMVYDEASYGYLDLAAVATELAE